MPVTRILDGVPWVGTKASMVFGLALLSALIVLFVAVPASVAQAAKCESRWFVSYGGDTNYSKVRTDPAGLKLEDLRFDWGYSDPFMNSAGYIDFNGDGETDVFNAKPLADGRYQWRYSPSARSGWINLQASRIAPGQLRFGDFEGDGITDVFAVLAPNEIGVRPWAYSDDGLSAFKPLAAIDDRGASALRFGDFNSDAKTDVFSTFERSDGFLQWQYSPGGRDPYISMAYAGTRLDKMRFGDIDGNGYTDVFTTLPTGDTQYPWHWVYSPGGVGNFESLLETTIGVGNIRLASFNSDYRSDMFALRREGDGFYHWYYGYFTPNAVGFKELAYDSRPISQLRLGDFDGDNVADVFALKRVC